MVETTHTEKPEQKREVKLTNARIKEAGYDRNLWVITTEMGVTRKDLLKPDYWSHVAMQLRPYDRIEARTDDGVYFAEYLVLASDRTFAKVKELSWHSLTSKDVALTQAEMDAKEQYRYSYRGANLKHSIIRTSDNQVVTEKHDSKESAMLWLKEHEKAMAG